LTVPLHFLLFGTLAFSGLAMGALIVAYRTDAMAPRRIREEKTRKLLGPAVYTRMLLNGLFSASVVFAVAYGLYPHLFYERLPGALRLVLEPVLILVVYDFTYYFMHRFPFHAWGPLKRAHAVHHAAKYPVAMDSLYLHPAETFLGIALLMACTYAVGPVHVYSFAAAFFVYTQLNIVVHCGLDLPFPFRALGYLANKHDKHHASMRAGNFASITPLPDWLFGTSE
jgi:sterol desaturase/sphingolipid hydroxylase (fatty acid hydroxylase superfamily)